MDRKIILFFVLSAASMCLTQQFDFRQKFGKSDILLQQKKGFTVSPNNNRDDSKENDYFPPHNTFTPKTNINLSTERIIDITPSPHYYPSDLSFRFSDVGLQRIGRNFIKSNSIISLSLDNNNISEISPFAFRSMRNLRHLNLSGNRIPIQKLLSLTGNHNLEMLIINNNHNNYDTSDNDNAEKILQEYEVFQKLEQLQLCNSQLRDIQVPFYIATPILTHLHLCNNSISSSRAVFDNIPSTLTHLKLDKNLIDRVEQGKLRNLQELRMNENEITQVCFEECETQSIPLKGAIKMRILSLSKNQISEVSSDAFNDMENLVNLDLSGNKITNLAKDTFNSTVWVTDLSLAYNILATIPNVCSMLNLKSLNLTGNRISAVPPDTFCRLQRLEYLYLSDNMITTIETRAFNLQSLMYLDLSGNQLKQLPILWISPWRIQELHLERNNFIELDDLSLKNIQSLRNVHLDENPMVKFRAESFQSFPGHVIFHLKNIRVNTTEDTKDYEDDDIDSRYID
ncbi:uncharacterized protein [Anoplolepis gracilipes]|uniref:uncharacterized protein n=1 Tax=Anoplolepis gracilipes TaxID=354296 RepID=UPI003BA319AB